MFFRTSEDPWAQHDYDVLPCEHEVDAHYHYRLVEYPLQEPEKWENARGVVSGERFADESHRSWASGCMDTLDADIATAEEHIRRLERHCARLRLDRLTLSSSLASIYIVPQDILLEMFSSLVRLHGNTLDVDAAPWILLRVCHRWRLIAQSSPFLWSTINIPLHCWSKSSPSAFFLKLVEHSLSVSCLVALSVSLDLAIKVPAGNDFPTVLMSTLSTHRARIRMLTFRAHIPGYNNGEHVSENDVFIDAFFNMTNACPMLEELDMFCHRYCRVRPALSCAPNLRRVRDLLPRDVGDQREPLGAFLNSSLTHFSCYTFSLENISILGQMPCLKELHLFNGSRAVIPTPQTPIRHSGVRYFSATLTNVLDHLILPSLEVL